MGEQVPRPPVWMMRQAGRYLPQYIKLRKRYDFFTRVQTPELACEITMQPIDLLQPDAAIIFSDILVVPQAMGLEVQMVESKGPYLPRTIGSAASVDGLLTDEAPDRLDYVYQAIRLTRGALNDRVPLIGFAGAPFTLLCYMVEGQGSKTFEKTRQFCLTQPQLAKRLLSMITHVTMEYLRRQVQAGAQCLQIFDSWSGLLAPQDFDIFARPWLEQIADALSPEVPVILFPKGSWYALSDLSRSSASALGVDWCISPAMARSLTGGQITLQGNLDPCRLMLPPSEIAREVTNMIDAFGPSRYIANLGHGILPHIPVESAMAFIDAVKSYQRISI